jgi:hypothetical protein
MKDILRLGLTIDDLRAINNCRLYLRALFVSDIADGSGMNILQEAWSSSERLHPYRAHNWHSFPKPSKAQEAVWQRYLKRCFLGRGRQLCQPLGAWITVDTGWEWFFSPQDRNLYCKTETGWL